MGYLARMPFRSDSSAPNAPEALDPLARFVELHAALEAERSWADDKVPLRLAAVCLITTPGEAVALASTTRRHEAALGQRLGWFSTVSRSVRILIAAQIVKHGDDPDLYYGEVERVRAMFRAAGLRSGHVYEFLAVLVLRRVLGGQAITAAHVERFRAIYEEMKRHHWWLTGPDDFPACAMLVGRDEDPATIGAGTHAIYEALHERADLWRGDPLQTAANVLYLSNMSPVEIAERFALLVAGFREGGARIGQQQYDELAILCFLPWPVERVVEVVLGFRARMRDAVRWLFKADALNLAASLAFVRLAGADGNLGPLADAKLLLDMQAVIAARAAAASA